MSDSLTLYKLIILYLLKKVNFPLTNGQISAFIVEEEYTSYFRSVVVFGRIAVLEDADAKRAAVERLALKYAPSDSAESRQRAIEREWDALCMLEMQVEHMTGKEAIELVRARKG